MVGETLSLTAQLKNFGPGPSLASNSRIVLSTDLKYDLQDSVIFSLPVPELYSQDSVSLSDSFVLTDSMTSNYYQIGIFADADTINHEMNRDNNFTCNRIIVQGYPRIYGLNPEPGEVIRDPKQTIYVKFREKFGDILTDSVSFKLDGEDITSKCNLTQSKIVYYPEDSLNSGKHKLFIRVRNSFGLVAKQSWDFEVEVETAITQTSEDSPEEYQLYQNFPNPFNGSTRITFSISDRQNVSLSVYNINGQLIKNLHDGYLNSGRFSRKWDGTSNSGRMMSSGIYIISLKAGNHSQSRRMLYLK